MRQLVVLTTLVACACGPASHAGVPEYTYEVVHVHPHDRTAFTEGLIYRDEYLYESTGLDMGRSWIRKIRPETGVVVQERQLSNEYFGEGIVAWKNKLYQLTYKNQVGLIYDLETLEKKGEFANPGQGWAFTTDGTRLYMDGARDVNAEASDAEIRIWDPETLRETGSIRVTDEGRPVENLNELEWVKGEIFANIWQTNRIACIDPKSGKVTGWIDLTGLLSSADREGAEFLNGIAYDAEHDRLFVTGKLWPKLFEIRLVKKDSR